MEIVLGVFIFICGVFMVYTLVELKYLRQRMDESSAFNSVLTYQLLDLMDLYRDELIEYVKGNVDNLNMRIDQIGKDMQ
jgi:hypothetical protein